ncbi:MAG: hypothetical protein AABZ10_06730 [Nitrospirota bacterium]
MDKLFLPHPAILRQYRYGIRKSSVQWDILPSSVRTIETQWNQACLDDLNAVFFGGTRDGQAIAGIGKQMDDCLDDYWNTFAILVVVGYVQGAETSSLSSVKSITLFQRSH